MDKTTVAILILLGISTLAIFSLKPENSNANTFQTFKTDFGKSYMNQAEESYRKTIFLKNLIKIQQHNSNKDNTYLIGVTQFADLTQQEFIASYLNTKVNPKLAGEDNFNARTQRPSELRGDIDWQKAGKTSPVKNQANCGSCWAFSATGAIESAYLLAGQQVLLSQQQLVDCSGSYGNMGCNGGWMDSAFQYVKDKGLKSSSQYPYKAVNQACAAPSGGSYKVAGFVDVPGCDNVINALSSRPISVAVDASNWSLYKSGVLASCGTAVNHGVLLVGATDAYWRIKNSWATTWGQNGFIRLARGNTCAVCSYPSYPTL